jgi:hypothetical protein
VAAAQVQLAAVVDAGPDSEAEELTQRLRPLPLELDVDAVEPATGDERGVKLTLDGDTREDTGVSSDEQRRLVARHAEDG